MKQTYLKVLTLFSLLIITTTYSKAQEVHSPSQSHNHNSHNQSSMLNNDSVKRVIINTTNPETLKMLYTKGFDFACGSKGVATGIQIDLNNNEIEILEDLNIPYEVTIENLVDFISARNNEKLPEAKAQLQQLKDLSIGLSPNSSKSLNENTRSFSQSSESIPSAIQYDGCAEIDWTPQNFVLGSMGGAYNYQEILDELARMQQLYPNIITVVKDASPTNQKTHGYTGTNPDIDPQTMWYVKISDNPDMDEAGEPQSLITGAAHAREVSSVMNIIYYMWYILESYDSDPLIKSMIDHQELYFIPVINPDGYIYNGIQAPNGGGNQRKNLRPGTGNGQYTQGVDLNRNSPYYWGIDDSGSSPSVTAGTYRGPTPASEPETQIIADFIQTKDIKLAVNHHSGLNSIVTSSYNGSTSAAPSGREDEFQELMQNVTHYNRYIHGSAPNTLYEANGDFNDWMLGGPPVTTNPSGGGTYTNSGSGKNIIAFTPENGDEFAPDPSHIVSIAKRALRMNLITSLSAGKYAQLHDLTNADITPSNQTLNFAVEYIGQTLDDLTLTVTPVSSNIASITPLSATALNGMAKLEQREVSFPITFNGTPQANELIEYEVTLSNGDFDIYKAVYRKYYNPTVVIDADGISNWTGNWVNYTNGYNGSTNAISVVSSGSYGNNIVRTTTLNNALDLSTSDGFMIQFNAFWDIERNFDLVQLEASTDGTNWTALCGKYNKPAAPTSVNNHFNNTKGGPGNPSSHQEDNGTYVYDGDQIVGGANKWVMEEVFIDFENNTQFLGETGVQLRFRFDSDVSNIQDGYNTDFAGFVFDNFKVLSLDSYAPELCDDAVINNFPHTESFENGLGEWSQNQEDDGDMFRFSGGTPSGTTGPNSASNGSFYLYTEATEDTDAPDENLGNNATAILTSPCFDLSNATSATFNFDYHMFGNNMGNLVVEVIDDESFTWTPLFTQNGSTGAPQNTWSSESAALTPYLNKTIKIRFVATTGNDFSSDIAIDNLELTAIIDDSVPPVASCQNITVSLGADGSVTILPSQIDNGSTDDNAISDLSLDIDTFDCSNIGNNTVTLTVTDSGNNSDSCTATVTVEPYITPPANLSASAIDATTAILTWDATVGSDYRLRFRESGTTSWTASNLTTNSLSLDSLTPEATYEVQVRANCSTGNTPYSAIVNFTTTAIMYCDAASADTSEEYISNVTLYDGTNDIIDNDSGANTLGYEDFTAINASIKQGATFSISITKEWPGTNYDEAIGVWIDYNRDGSFDGVNEEVFIQAGNQITPVIENNLTIPLDATLGETRMRVIMRYQVTPEACGNFDYGQVEDYTLTILPASTDYVYDNGLWTPQDPSGIATIDDNIQVLSGTTALTANTFINNVTVSPGATLDLGTTTLSTAGNITNTGALTASDATVELNGTSAQSIFGNEFELGSLTLNNPAGAILSAPLKLTTLLTLTNGQLNTSNLLTLGSDVNGTAMVDVITGGSIVGNVTTERYIPARRAFRLLSSSVTSTTSININWQEGGNNTGTNYPTDNVDPNPGYGTHITGSTTGENGFDATGSGNPSLFALNNGAQAWEAITNTDVTTLTAGTPLRLMVRGDRSIDLTTNAATPSNTTLRSTGTLATATIQTTGADLNHNAGAFNFIGNPYQASVNVNDVLAGSNNIKASEVWVWDATLGARGQYVTVLLDGTGSSNGATSKSYHYIQPGQSFFTATENTVGDNSTSVVFNETDKAVGNDVTVFNNNATTFASSSQLIAKLYRTDRYGTYAGLQDNFVILYDNNYSNELTSEDVSKFYNIDENMGILKEGTLLSVDKLAMPTENDEVQLYNALYRVSNYTLDITVNGFNEVTPYLEDTYTGELTMLENGLNTITFSVDETIDASIDATRFKIVYQAQALSTEGNEAIDFAMYPNPVTDGTLSLTATKLAGLTVDVTITNLLGQQVIAQPVSFTGATATLTNLHNLKAGVYILSITSQDVAISHRIVIQ